VTCGFLVNRNKDRSIPKTMADGYCCPSNIVDLPVPHPLSNTIGRKGSKVCGCNKCCCTNC
jgi:hypothetical protein